MSYNDDVVSVIVKIAFGNKSEVYPDRYIDEMREGKWTRWNTPRKYQHLGTKGNKLILYDSTRKALTLEVEIQEVKEQNDDPGYPWSNVFAPGSLNIFETGIPVESIRKVKGFENFSVFKKDRSPYRNVTRQQYESLLKHQFTYDIESAVASEGYMSERKYLSFERNRDIVRKRRIKDDYTCQSCGFRLEVEGRFVIECHHVMQLADTGETITTINDLVSLCPTCHRIAHICRPPLGVADVKTMRESM
jgi:5-methylcytosine-specific restriction endonuclease McrA